MNRNLHDEEGLEDPERVPSLLTARELQAKDPARKEKSTRERDASASFADDNDARDELAPSAQPHGTTNETKPTQPRRTPK